MYKVHVDFDREVNIKRRIRDNLHTAIKDYERRPGVQTDFAAPIIRYVNAKHPLFRLFMEEDRSLHPKGIYRPGNTVIVFFLPYSPEVARSNRGGEDPSPEWTDAFHDSMHLAMELNRVIGDTLDEVGRLHSPANTPMDWNLKTQREEWSHKLAAYTAGMGRFGIAGSFHTEMGFAGRVGCVFTDYDYAPLKEEELARVDLANTIDYIDHDSKYLGAKDVTVSQEAIDSCPAGAIIKEGICKERCQERCLQINPHIPSPEVCGKCFFYDV